MKFCQRTRAAVGRVRMLTVLAANQTPLLAYQFAWAGIGHVAKDGDGFRYFPPSVQQPNVG